MRTKQSLRDKHITFRRQLANKQQEKLERDTRILQHTLEALEHFGAIGSEISAYYPLGSEPGTADYPLQLARRTKTVWLPISLPHGELQWAACSEDQRPGALGIAEPVGSRFSSEVLKECAALVVPALAVDRSGQRLGKGAGYYDRALEHIRNHNVPIIAVVFDEEVVDTLPAQPHDVPVNAIVTDRTFLQL
ncbi:5-formyltetrahydrofolate cyclo-ligase [Corynebacterium sp. NML130628]|uniref:5-formyltetrahydrofolate cyclo-ligase n=1 Tax=Corynebacterium sp. NML130628 TaxID=1906333 RepID=UPI0008FB8423|nr:5-formyltetrahydrofolate cyclo-ligase [Corynebacterium sp. NML130628]OIR43470.1 5-formyltetrahydrofolate cyclo-ligase [Corynebacterium sp. NML130628]